MCVVPLFAWHGDDASVFVCVVVVVFVGGCLRTI